MTPICGSSQEKLKIRKKSIRVSSFFEQILKNNLNTVGSELGPLVGNDVIGFDDGFWVGFKTIFSEYVHEHGLVISDISR